MFKRIFIGSTISLALILGFGAVASEHPTGVSPDEALRELQAGNKRFVEGKVQHPHEDSVRRTELAKGQKPNAIILSCSDSRVPPEVVFDQGLGDVFAVRVAGNVLGAATVASMEYAVEHLGARLIVVMGHESCGAVGAALNTPVGKSAGSYDLDNLVSEIRPALESVDRSSIAGDKILRKPVMMNVDAVIKRLQKRSKIIRKHIEGGSVQVVPAIYGLSSGVVDFY